MRTWVVAAVLLVSGCETIFPLDPPGANCQADYTELDLGGTKGRYRFETTTATNFFAAQQQCASEGAHLAVLGSQTSATAEVAILAGQIDPTITSDLFIGLSNGDQITADSYQWITDEPIPVPLPNNPPWDDAQPLDPDKRHCGQLDHVSGQLRSEDCGIEDFYICECDGRLADPARF